MIITIQKTNASKKRRKELQRKIDELFLEYTDVPIMACHLMKLESIEQPTMISFGIGEEDPENEVHIFRGCILNQVKSYPQKT
jgi:hypothetical protein